MANAPPGRRDRSDSVVIAGTVAAGASNFMAWSAVMHVVNAIPAVFELYIGILHFSEPCKKTTDKNSSTPLQWWLIADGSVALFVITAGLISLYLCGHVDKEAVLYQIHRQRGNTEDSVFVQDPEMERQVAAQEAQRQEATRVSGLCGCFPLFIYAFGWAFWTSSSDKSCSPIVRETTYWVLIYRAAEYLFFCCCCVPLFFACGLSSALADSMAQDGEPAGE